MSLKYSAKITFLMWSVWSKEMPVGLWMIHRMRNLIIEPSLHVRSKRSFSSCFKGRKGLQLSEHTSMSSVARPIKTFTFSK